MTPVRPERIDQVVPSLGRRDAIGTHVLHLRGVLRGAGFASDIWCRGAFDDVRAECRLVSELPGQPRPGTWWLYHLATGSSVADVLARRPEPLLVDYHNLTPPQLLESWAPEAAADARLGRRQLAELAPAVPFAMADSAFNDGDLRVAGYRRTAVVPPLFDPGAHERSVDGEVRRERERERSGGGADWLFVGRLAPSKAQHDVVKAFACFRRWFDPAARLHLVGTSLGREYPAAVRRFARRLGLEDAVRLPGSVSDEALAAYYATSDVFVCLSDHEGFCIPVVEAMHLGLPVVAYDAGAVAETVGTGGVVLTDKTPMSVAVTVDHVLRHPELRSRLVAAGRAQAASFSFDRSRARWRAVIEQVVTTDVGPQVRCGRDHPVATRPAGAGIGPEPGR